MPWGLSRRSGVRTADKADDNRYMAGRCEEIVNNRAKYLLSSCLTLVDLFLGMFTPVLLVNKKKCNVFIIQLQSSFDLVS